MRRRELDLGHLVGLMSLIIDLGQFPGTVEDLPSFL